MYIKNDNLRNELLTSKTRICGEAIEELNKLFLKLKSDTKEKTIEKQFNKKKKEKQKDLISLIYKEIKAGTYKMKDFDYSCDLNLTKTEEVILSLLLGGYNYNECAQKTNTSILTVKTHINSIFGKKHVNSIQELLVKEFRKINNNTSNNLKVATNKEINKLKISKALAIFNKKF